MIKPHHPLVLVPFHKKWPGAAAMAVVVKHRRIGHEKYSPAAFAKAHAPIQIFAMQEIGFIPQAHIVDRRSAHQHQRTGNRFHVDRRIRQRLLMQMKIEEKPGLLVTQANQAKSPHKRAPRRGHRPPPAALLAAVQVGQQPTHHAHA